MKEPHPWETLKNQTNKQIKQKDDKEPLRQKENKTETKKFFHQACIPVSSAPPAPTALLRKVPFLLLVSDFAEFFIFIFLEL